MIELIDINKIYSENSNEHYGAFDINLSFNNTGLYILSGRSGCGKTTILNILYGLIKPDKGIYKVNGHEFENEKDGNYISYIFQDYKLFDCLTVKENICKSSKIKHIKFFNEIVKQLEINDLLNKKVSSLSTGQRQRVAIARTVYEKPDIIIADEPTSNLDDVTAKKVFELLDKISKEVLVIVATHDVQLLNNFNYTNIILKDGTIERIDDNKNELVANNGRIIEMNNFLPYKSIFKATFLENFALFLVSLLCVITSFLSINFSTITQESLIIKSLERESESYFSVSGEGINGGLTFREIGNLNIDKRNYNVRFSSCKKEFYELEKGTLPISDNDLYVSDVFYFNYIDTYDKTSIEINGNEFNICGCYKTQLSKVANLSLYDLNDQMYWTISHYDFFIYGNMLVSESYFDSIEGIGNYNTYLKIDKENINYCLDNDLIIDGFYTSNAYNTFSLFYSLRPLFTSMSFVFATILVSVIISDFFDVTSKKKKILLNLHFLRYKQEFLQKINFTYKSLSLIFADSISFLIIFLMCKKYSKEFATYNLFYELDIRSYLLFCSIVILTFLVLLLVNIFGKKIYKKNFEACDFYD